MIEWLCWNKERQQFDLFSQHLKIPLVRYFGQKIHSMPTSITIGIKNVEETLIEAKEYTV